MIDLVSFILIVIFIPIVFYTAVKIYKPQNINAVIKILVFIFLGFEIVRFFYNASLYSNAVTPANALTFSYISVFCVLSLFARFNMGKIGEYCKKLITLTALVPLVLALFNAKLYTNALDNYAVLKALYFVETGLALTLALIYILNVKVKISVKEAMAAFVFFLVYIGINALTFWLWKNAETGWFFWFFEMIIAFSSIGLMYLFYFTINLKDKRKN